MAYQGLASSPYLKANALDPDGHVPFLYMPNNVDWGKYSDVILDPVTVYSGPDQQFGNTSNEGKAVLAAYAHDQFADALTTHGFPLVGGPGPDTLRIRITLTGAGTNTPILATITKMVPAGIVINTVQSVRDKQAIFSGSVSYAVEIYDSTSDHLLRAYVSEQYPLAMNVFASLGPLDAARAGLRDGAEQLASQLH